MDRFVRFETTEGIHWGMLEEEGMVMLSGNPVYEYTKLDRHFRHGQVRLKAPVEPSKIVAVGLNYRAHVDESQSADEVPEEPVIFLKPPSSLIGPGEKIVLPEQSQRVDYEAELGVVIGRECCRVAAVEAEDYIFGFTCVNDVTARDLQKKDKQWTRGKGFDTFCPVGPWVIDKVNYKDILVESYLNEDLRQSARTSSMIFTIPNLIAFISQIMTLYPGDLISTGTPAGVGPMKSGDRCEIRIENIGSLVNDVV